MLQEAPECQVVRIGPSLPLLCPNLQAHEWRTIVTATTGDFSDRVKKPTKCLYHVNSGQAPSCSGGQSSSTTVEAPVTTSLSKDDTVVQAAIGDELTGAIFLVVFINKTKTVSCFYPFKAHASSFTTRLLVEGRTVRSADNDRFTLQYKNNSRKGSLMESNRSDLAATG